MLDNISSVVLWNILLLHALKIYLELIKKHLVIVLLVQL